MKIYTEVVYAWDDNKGELVEESSKSFDYEGEVTLCHSRTKRVGSKWTGYYNISIPHTHASVNQIKLPKIEIGGSTGEALDAGKTGIHTATTAGKNTLHAAASAGKTNLAYGADAGKALLHEGADFAKKMWDRARGKTEDEPDTTVGSTTAPGKSATMGQGGQDLMKGATMAFTKKSTVGSGGKRKLTKIKKKGSSGARV